MIDFARVSNRELQNHVNDLQAMKDRLIGWTYAYEIRLKIAKELLVRRVHDASLPGDWNEDSSLEKWFPLTAEQIISLKDRVESLEKECAMLRGMNDVCDM